MHVCSSVCTSPTGFVAGGFDRHAVYDWLRVRTAIKACTSLNVERKCWKRSCEHIAFSVMCPFLGSSQEFYFFLLPSSLAAPYHRHAITLGLYLKAWHTHRPHATINYMRFWQATQWLWGLKRRRAVAEKASWTSILFFCEAQLKVPVSCCVYPRALTQWPS